MAMEHLDGVVTSELRLECIGEQAAPHSIAKDGDAMKVRLDRIAPQRLERRFRAHCARRPIGFGIELSQKPEHRAAQREGQRAAQPLFAQM
jgi:hypothetical protein